MANGDQDNLMHNVPGEKFVSPPQSFTPSEVKTKAVSFAEWMERNCLIWDDEPGIFYKNELEPRSASALYDIFDSEKG